MNRLSEWGFTSKKMELEEDFYIDYGAEEITDYRDPGELLAALKQKEEEVLLAAQLGNALLLENRQLKEHSDQLHEQYTDKLEELEQGRHELRLKLEGCQSQWESQVGDLERDVRDLSAQVEQLAQALSQAERDKSRVQMEHSDHTQRLKEQLHTAMEVERAMSMELQALKQELQQKGSHNRLQDEELISAMKEQLAEAWQEVEVARGRSQQLQAQVEELQEEVSLQESTSHGELSLLSELESSLDTAELGVSREELLLPLTQEAGSEVTVQEADLQVMLQQLKRVAQTLAQASSTQLNPAFVEETGDQCGNLSAAQELRDQNTQLQQENTEMRQKLQSVGQQTETTQQAIRDRDEAIANRPAAGPQLRQPQEDHSPSDQEGQDLLPLLQHGPGPTSGTGVLQEAEATCLSRASVSSEDLHRSCRPAGCPCCSQPTATHSSDDRPTTIDEQPPSGGIPADLP
ncbi:unnamed protein product [Lampetra planeri]